MSITDDTELAELADIEERTLPGHRSQVILADGTTFVVRITNREYLAWDKTAPRKKWGTAQAVPFLAATFMAWAAARREDLTSLNFDQFSDVCEEVSDLPEEPEDIARPTQKGPGGA